jgi:CBS domain-containing protein
MRSVLVKDCMTRKVATIAPGMEIAHATQFLIAHNISGAPVLDKFGRLVGILTEKDCLQVVMQSIYHGQPGGLVKDFMNDKPVAVSPEQSILTLAEKFIQGPYHRYPVVDNGRLVGIISRRDVMRAIGQHYPSRKS